jgi:2-polyprenyl-3-methyl-5-hydroxy-6-metoxy-1,4-benzoquinol methylase
METIKCIFCEKENEQIVFEEKGYKALRCRDCGLIYVSPRPSIEEIKSLYSNDSEYARGHIKSAFDKRLFARHNIRIIKRFLRKGNLLEIGAGAGYFLDEARKAGFSVFGIEFNSIEVGFIRNTLNIPCEETPLGDQTYDGKNFDIIYHCNVISHMYDPIGDFRKIHNRLVDNGLVVFETGNMPEVDRKYYKYINKFNLPEHLFFFNENNIKELLKITGFKLVNIYKYSILNQLRFRRKFAKKSALKIKNKKPEKDNNPGISTKRSKKQDLKMTSYCYLHYFMRYIKGRPQTMIIVARKQD